MSLGRVVSRILPVAFLTLPLVSCSGSPSDSVVLTAEVPLHLEDHLDAATIEGSEVPAEVPEAVEWRFDEPQPDWKPVVPVDPSSEPIRINRTPDALRLTLTEANTFVYPWGKRGLRGGIYVDLPEWYREDWAQVLVRARTTSQAQALNVGFNLKDRRVPSEDQWPFHFSGESSHMINDGSVHTYVMRADWWWGGHLKGGGEDQWRQLGLMVAADEPVSIDIVSVSVIPKETGYADAPAGVRTEVRNQAYRRVLYTHAPGRIEYPLRVPEAGRLDVGLGVLRDDAPVTFRITARRGGGGGETLFEETHGDKERWAQRSVDLSHLAGHTITLGLVATADHAGAVALWAAPTLSGSHGTEQPNVVLYVIDGAGADYMSVYGYNRRTTPNLERLAREGAIFERAYSNSTWTKPSTMSFMTSLHHSVLGGYKTNTDPLPDEAVTMAQHMHDAGYQTAVFTSNAWPGTMSSLDRGVDALREAGVEPHSASSRALHEDFWRWRESYPGEPYWVHFQTTDVHWPWNPVAPFDGLYISPQRRETYHEWERQLPTRPGPWTAFDKIGVSRIEFFNAARGLYDETMAHQDYQLGQLVERLKARGEWKHTLLIVAADHGYGHGVGLLDPLPPRWGPMFRSFTTRVPLIVIWPERIAGGQRFSQPVSMIDVLPTILELAGVPMPEVMQGQSLAALLLGEEGWEPRPVILDEFYVDQETGELGGSIEVIDGRWGASLEINPSPDDEEVPPEESRPAVLLYDLRNDPYCLHSLHEERPDLLEKYTALLEAQWEAHQALAQVFTRSGEVALTPEQLRTLRSLGYIQ